MAPLLRHVSSLMHSSSGVCLVASSQLLDVHDNCASSLQACATSSCLSPAIAATILILMSNGTAIILAAVLLTSARAPHVHNWGTTCSLHRCLSGGLNESAENLAKQQPIGDLKGMVTYESES